MKKKKELLFSLTKDDFTIQTFKAGGKGGQHQNKTDSGVRIIHKDSKVVGLSRSDRSQHRNKKLAFERLTKVPEFKKWIRQKANEIIDGKTIDQRVQEMLAPKYIKMEVMDKYNKWMKVNKINKTKEERDGSCYSNNNCINNNWNISSWNYKRMVIVKTKEE